jgi:hypothetical protein
VEGERRFNLEKRCEAGAIKGPAQEGGQRRLRPYIQSASNVGRGVEGTKGSMRKFAPKIARKYWKEQTC